MISSGLEGVVAATTRSVTSTARRGELLIAGFPVGDLAAHATFEETTWLLWHGDLPTRGGARRVPRRAGARRALPPATLALLRECARARVDAMDALRIALGTVSLTSSEAVAIVALAPTIVAAFSRLSRGHEPIEPRADLGHAANYLYMLDGALPDAEHVRGLETYLNTVVDHGLNASTFTCRVITSTGSDLVSAVVGAVGALKGPLHGGAPGPALETVFEIGEASRAEAGASAKDRSGRAAHGLRTSRVQGPRSARRRARGGRRATLHARRRHAALHAGARRRDTALRLLEEYKPGRRLADQRRVLHGAAAPRPRARRTALHADVRDQPRERMDRARVEQRAANRLIRPKSEYVGPRDRRWSDTWPSRLDSIGEASTIDEK